jgi:hypothetical protein
MKALASQSNHRGRLHFWLTLLPAAAGVCVVLLATSRYGIGLTPDSAAYIGAARNLNAGRGVFSYDGTPMASYGPLYPMTLALIGRIAAADALAVAPFAHALLFGLLVFSAGWLGRIYRPDGPALPLLLSLAALVAVPYFDIAVTAWSELLFLQFSLGVSLSAGAYMARPRRRTLALLTLFSAAACLTRYLGVTLVAAGALAILLAGPGRLRGRLGWVAGYAAFSLLPVGVWMLRNYRLTATFFGERVAASQPLRTHLLALFETAASWYGLPTGSAFLRLLVIGLGVLAAACVAVLLWRSRPSFGRRQAGLGLLVFFAGFYLLALLSSQMGVALTPIGQRYMSPVYLPLALLTLVAAEWLYCRPFPGWPQRALRVALICLGIVWLAWAGASLALKVMDRVRFGAGYYHRVEWSENGAIQYLRQGRLGEGRLIYTNVAGGVYLLMDGWEVKGAKRLLAQTRATRRSWCERKPALEPAFLLIFDARLIGHEDEFSMSALREMAQVEEAAAFEDSAIYAVTPLVGPCP